MKSAPSTDPRLGIDLLVVPSFAAHDAAQVDLVRRRRDRRGPALAPGAQEAFDLDVVSGRENVAQALLLRLLTPVGALASLGHPSYGSRLHELIGEHKTESLRNLCRTFVLEAIAQEPRIEAKAVEFTFDREEETVSSFAFTLQVRTSTGDGDQAFSLEVQL